MKLGASPPPAPVYKDRLTGTSSDFLSSNGDWSASGGTLSYDTSNTYCWNASGNNGGSLKHLSSADQQYVEVTVPGVFKAGVQYNCLIVYCQEENQNHSFKLSFGIHTTDYVTQTLGVYAGDSVCQGRYIAVNMRWTPTADRTNPTVRVTHNTATATTLHIGHVRVFEMEVDDLWPILAMPKSNAIPPRAGYGLTIQPSFGASRLSVGQKQGGIEFGPSATYIGNDATNTGYTSMWVSTSEMGVNAEGTATPGDMIEEGVWIEVGSDYVGFYISELDDNTVQWYADSDDYMMQLRHRGTGGWAVSPDGAENGRIEAFFDHVLRIPGAQSVATDVADYLVLWQKARIEEVFVHAGTAPTGQALIVDINDDGTTIFTTQGNRPSIADAANDATSGTPDGGTTVAAGSVITVDVDQVGSGTAGSDLYVSIRGRYIW